MAFGVTPEGFKAKKFEDIISELSSSLKTQLNIDIDANPDSVAKVLTNIYSLALAEEWALPQALQSMFDIDQSEGKHLDDLVGYIGMRRLSAVNSFGNGYISGDKITTIPANSIFKDANLNTYFNPDPIIVSNSNCVYLEIEVPSTTPIGSIITFVINGVPSEVTIDVDIPTAITLLVGYINNKTSENKITALDISSGGVSKFSLTNTDDRIASIVNSTTNVKYTNIISFGKLLYSTVGEFSIPANTVNTPPTIVGILNVDNRYAFVSGRLTESDIDLRNRHKLSVSTAGSTTVEAIRADLLKITGVVTATVIENDTEFTDILGLPPKSFLSVVKGGTDQDIADTLWYEGKAAGIQTYGDITVSVVDSQGENQYINFSRPTPVYIHIHVDYSKYDEQLSEFPLDGEQQMSNQIVSYGDSLAIGEDVIPQRFSSEVFQNVGGLSVVNLYVGTTVGANDPTPALSSNIISIDQLSEANFDNARITFTEI